MALSPEQHLPRRDEGRNLPKFNLLGKDEMGLGHTPSTRSAELVAGARAFLMRTPETMALSRVSGVITAQILTRLGGIETNVLWFFPARMMAIETLTERLVPKNRSNLLLVDLAAGFSPRGLHMARNYPQAEVIEIDLPQVIAEKKQRLARGRIEIPSNLTWIEADLGSTNLQDVLGGRKADLITSEGLSLYLTPTEQARFFSQVEANLAHDGVFVTELYFQDKLQRLRQSRKVNSVASFVIRLVGNLPGLLPDQASCYQRLTAAGLLQSEECPLAEMMEKAGQPKPLDVISVIIARKMPTQIKQ